MQEIRLYDNTDIRCAARRLRSCILLLAMPLLLLLAAYIFAIVKGMRLLMLGILLAGFIWSVLCCDLRLLPALRYASFLREVDNGPHRRLDCRLESVSPQHEMQDGARVQALQVRRMEDGETRIFYMNASKAECLPPMGSQVQITSHGRHIVAFRLL